MAVTPVQRKKYFEARTAGFSIAESARKAKFSEATAYRVEKAAQNLRADEGIDSSASNYRELKKEAKETSKNRSRVNSFSKIRLIK